MKRAVIVAICLLAIVTVTLFTLRVIDFNQSNTVLVTNGLIKQDAVLSAETVEQTDAQISVLNTKSIQQNNVLIVKGRPNWKLEGRFSEHLIQLADDSRNGDNEASYTLAMNLRYCYFAPLNNEELADKLETVSYFADAERSAESNIRRFEYCVGVDSDLRGSFYSYLELAANAGYVPAQEQMGSITPTFYMESQGYKTLPRDEYIKVRDKFKEEQIEQLESAVNHGSIPAMLRLSNIYFREQATTNARIKAFAINQTILEHTQDEQIYQRFTSYQQNMYNSLTSQELEKVLDMSEVRLSEVEKNGTLYLSHFP